MKSYKYIDYILRRKCFLDFCTALKKVDQKEWTECTAMMNFFKKAVDFYEVSQDQNTIVFDVGCGKRPTLATMLILNIASIKKVIAIDPQLDIDLCHNISDIELIRDELKNVNIDEYNIGNAIVCCNHAHIHISEIMDSFLRVFDSFLFITSPCCFDNKPKNIHGLYVRDRHVWSEKNEYYAFMI